MKIFAVIPRAGIGNRLLVWARALVFSRINNCPLILIGLNKFHIGPIIRNEKSKRFYLGSFRFNNGVKAYFNFFFINKKHTIYNPVGYKLEEIKINNVVFNKTPNCEDYFDGLRVYRELVKQELFKIISKKVYNIYIKSPAPYIGVHIRMGDFKEIENLEQAKNIGLARTPIKYFINCINQIRTKKGDTLPVTIFSDGHYRELKDIMELNNVTVFNSGNDLADMLVLSKSKIIITSMGSTFGYWASFLSSASVIHNSHGNYSKTRNNTNCFEGNLEDYLKERNNEF